MAVLRCRPRRLAVSRPAAYGRCLHSGEMRNAPGSEVAEPLTGHSLSGGLQRRQTLLRVRSGGTYRPREADRQYDSARLGRRYLHDVDAADAVQRGKRAPLQDSVLSEGPSPEGDGFGRHKHAQSAEADFRSRPDRRLSAAVLRRFRSLRDLLKASPKGEEFHPSPMGTLRTVLRS